MTAVALKKVFTAYDNLLKQVPILVYIENESGYELALDFIEALMEEIGDNPDDPRWILLEIATKSVDDYEARVYPEMVSMFESYSGPLSIIRVLMDQYQLSPSELPEIGSQALVEQVLNGKKQLNLNQVKALSQRFKIDPALFF
jgi:HTH-type transcriptional regulator/antitoxin HigA